MFEWTNKWENKILDLTQRYEDFLKKIVDCFEKVLLKIFYLIKIVFLKILDLLNHFGKFLRYSTWPLHWIWIKLFLVEKEEERLEDLPIFQLGAHYIYGLPKCGKSTIIYHAMMDYAYHTGKTSYTTAMMEIPRKNLYGIEYYLHQLFAPTEFYQEGIQIVQFNIYLHNIIVYEEVLASGMHQRNNAKKSYNDIVLPMIASMGTQRHQGIDLFYFISQLPRNDISLMHMLAGYHEPKIKKIFDYKNWLKTGKFRLKIKGWVITSQNIEPTSGSDYKLVNKRKWFYKCIHQEDMNYFNRLNMKDHYSKLPLHKGVEMS